jgi:hypothetical protein
MDFHFDMPRLCVPECIPQCFDRDPIDFVAHDRMQILRGPFQLYLENGCTFVGFIG